MEISYRVDFLGEVFIKCWYLNVTVLYIFIVFGIYDILFIKCKLILVFLR